jgi:hypothetical protein
MTTTAVDATTRVPKPPTEGQLRFAIEGLKLEIPEDTPGYVVRRMINKEVRRRGRAALNSGNYFQYVLVRHPKNGVCEIARIGHDTLKVTLAPVDGGCKFVINAMTLESCEVIED